MPSRYERWKAPAVDGQTLIWPRPPELLQQLSDNLRLLSTADAPRLQNVPLSAVRGAMRAWLGHDDPQQPLIATGHQAELHHPGVWVKNALIDAAARKAGGRAMHFAVDTDQPKHLRLRWPGGSIPLSDAEHPAEQWSGLIPPPSPAHVAEVRSRFATAAAGWPFQPLVGRFLDSMRRLSLESSNLPSALTNAVHELDWSLDLRHDALLVSPICLSEPYLLFAHHVLARADEFAGDYNAALEEYRRENRIRTPGRPMPNLRCTPDGCEAPFWLDDLTTGRRQRAGVVREAGGFALRLENGEQFVFDGAAEGWAAAGKLMLFLRRTGMRLSPRALTLTAVLRLLAADQFVHGIGGGQYDQVLDKLIWRHLRLEPPRFSVTTATLYFPQAVGESRVCMPCLEHDGHRLKHALLGAEKQKWVAAIASAPRRSTERSLLFADMHEKLATAAEGEPYQRWQASFAAARERLAEEKALFDRELFYAVQPASRLLGMIERYRSAFDAS